MNAKTHYLSEIGGYFWVSGTVQVFALIIYLGF